MFWWFFCKFVIFNISIQLERNLGSLEEPANWINALNWKDNLSYTRTLNCKLEKGMHLKIEQSRV